MKTIILILAVSLALISCKKTPKEPVMLTVFEGDLSSISGVRVKAQKLSSAEDIDFSQLTFFKDDKALEIKDLTGKAYRSKSALPVNAEKPNHLFVVFWKNSKTKDLLATFNTKTEIYIIDLKKLEVAYHGADTLEKIESFPPMSKKN